MPYGTQLFALMIVFIVANKFLQYRRLNLVSTKMFEYLVTAGTISICAEIVCDFALFYPGYFTSFSIKFFHQINYGTIAFMGYYSYVYLEMRSRSVRDYTTLEFLIRVAPLAVALIYVLLGDFRYHVDNNATYARGPAIDFVYISLAIYAVFALRAILKDMSKSKSSDKFTFVLGFSTWAAINVYHYFYPQSGLSCISNAIILVFIFLRYENSQSYIDKDVPTLLSKNSFSESIKELFASKQTFYLINFSLQNKDALRSAYGLSSCLKYMEETAKTIPVRRNVNFFRTAEFSFGFILFDRNDIKELESRYKIDENILAPENTHIQGTYLPCIVECPKYASDYDSLMKLLVYCKHNIEVPLDREMVEVNDEINKKRSYKSGVEKLLQKAVDEDGFYIVYQPIYNAKTQKFESAEALIRLKDTQTMGFVSPELFISIAERRGLIGKIGEIVVQKVCEFTTAYKLKDLGIKYIEINISPLQISDPSFSRVLHNYVKASDIDPSFFNLELTETASMISERNVENNMKVLKSLGYGFSMDDFGSGYSNLSQIASIHYDLVKLDKTLIWPAMNEENKQALSVLHAVIPMTHSLGAKIVAEGVETKKMLDYLVENGVEFIQGYYFSKPLNENDFISFIKEKNGIIEEPKDDDNFIISNPILDIQ